MKPLKKTTLCFIALILLINLPQTQTQTVTSSKCFNCHKCNEEKGICEVCNNGYRTSYSFPSNCIQCSNSGDYVKFSYNANPISCQLSTDSCSEMMVYDTNECVDVCPANYFKFNKICYKECPENTIIDTTKDNTCKCAYKYTEDPDTKLLTCYSKGDPCPVAQNYFDEDDKKCLTYDAYKAMTDKKDYRREVVIYGIVNYQLINQCNDDEFEWKISPALDTKPTYECVKDCRLKADSQYHIYNSKTCIKKCRGYYYRYQKDYTCYPSAADCPTSYNILKVDTNADDGSKPIHECADFISCTESNYPYLYELTNTCLDKCSNTLTSAEGTLVSTGTLYELIEPSDIDPSKEVKKCVLKCPISKPFMDIDGDTKRCVDKCGQGTTRLYISEDGTECVTRATCGNNKYVTVDTFQCAGDACPSDYYTNSITTDYNCYRTCLYIDTNNYHNLDTKKCVPKTSCNCIIEGDENHICYDNTKCPSFAPYYNDDGSSPKKCFSSSIGCNDPNNDPKYFYHDNDDPFKCISSCSQYMTEDYGCLLSHTGSGSCGLDVYPYLYKKICFKKCPDNSMFVDPSDINLECKYPFDCPKTHYIQNGKCVETPDLVNYPYKIVPESVASDSPGYVFKTIEECYNLNYNYIKENTNECLNSCSSSSYKIQIEPGTFHPYKRDKGTCLLTATSCPDDFPYLYDYSSNKICYKGGCPTGTYIVSQPRVGAYKCGACTSKIFQDKECVDDCSSTTDIFFVDDGITKKCVHKCPDELPFYSRPSGSTTTDFQCQITCGSGEYYDPDTKECLSSCKNQIKKFFFESSSTSPANPCLESCPDGYYYVIGDYKCLPNCASYHSSTDIKACVASCGENEKIDYNNACVEECPEYFYYSKLSSTSSIIFTKCANKCNVNDKDKTFADKSFTILINSTNQCIPNVEYCPSTDNFLYDSKCLKKCPSESPFYEQDNKHYVCLSSCAKSTATNPTTNNNYNNNFYCREKCYSPYNYYVDDEVKKYECLTSCPDDYPIAIGYKCSKLCPTDNYNKDGSCVSSCKASSEKPFSDPLTQTCVSQCPNKLPFYGADKICSTACPNVNNKVLPTNECVANCPANFNFVGRSNICKTKCDPLVDGEYYYLSVSEYICVESCTKAKDDKIYHIEGNFECITKDACLTTIYNKYTPSPSNICYSICNHDPNYPFTSGDNCLIECPPETFYLEDKVCSKNNECKTNYDGSGVINQYGKCVSMCDLNSKYKFNITLKNTDNEEFMKCDISCESDIKGNYFYSLSDYKCVSYCSAPNNFVREGKICDSSCGSDALYYTKNSDGAYECQYECPSDKYYFKGTYECLSDCGANYIIENTHICVSSCLDESGYYTLEKDTYNSGTDKYKGMCVKNCLEYSEKPYTYEATKKCGPICTSTNSNSYTSLGTYIYYRERDKICLTQCPENYHYDSNTDNDSHKCISNCQDNPDVSTQIQFLLPSGKCASKCNEDDSDTLYQYYIPGENECLLGCPKNYYYKNGETINIKCVKSCSEIESNLKVVNNGQCYEKCSDANNGNKYSIKTFTHGEVDIQPKCMSDCNQYYPYTDDPIGSDNFYCIGSCLSVNKQYYISQPNLYVKTCQDKCSDPTKFVGNNNECLGKCPSDKPYIKKSESENDENVICYEKCPDDAPYHERENPYQCLSACDGYEAINYDNGECMKNCEQDQVWKKDSDIGDKKICLKECIPKYGFFSDPKGECLVDCTEDENKFFANYTTQKCECVNLYSIEETDGTRDCYDPTILSCSQVTKYIYLQENTKRCIEACKTVVSPMGVCLNSSTCPENSSPFRNPDGIYKCFCNYKFYKDDLKQSICLGKDEQCPPEYKYYIPETKECTKACPTDEAQINIFFNYCVENCPPNADTTNNKCTCKSYWYIDPQKVGLEEEIEYICLEDESCTKEFPLKATETKQCLSKCEGPNYIYYNGECLQKCDSDTGLYVIPMESNSPFAKYGNSTCRCSNPWFYLEDSFNIECLDSDKTCSDSNKKFMIKDTKRCVDTCPEDYPYSINYTCFSDCEKNGKDHGLLLKNDELTKKCKCVNPWKWANTDKTLIECSSEAYCTTSDGKYDKDYLLIDSTKECIKSTQCQHDHPLEFNGVCYDLDKNGVDTCPEKTIYDSRFSDQCICEKLWYYTDSPYKRDGDGTVIQDKYCLPKDIDECPVSLTTQKLLYRNETNNACIDSCKKGDEYNLFAFNFVCYEKCPLNTIEGSTADINGVTHCECDTTKETGKLWYQYTEKSETFYKCGLDSCPKEKPFYTNDTFECIHDCKDRLYQNNKNYFSYDNACYTEGCPEKTKKDEDTTLFYCYHRSIADEEEVKDRETLYTHVQEDILFYYTHNVTTGGFFFQKYNVSLQIYGLNKNGQKGKDYHIQKANLSFIDMNICLEQIYKMNSLADDEDVIVVKYDLLNISTKYAINPVEYEFYSSVTGKKLDSSVCSTYSISVSYPITYIASKYDDYTNNEYKNSFKDLFNRGKALNKKDKNIDTFNSNNSIYYDLCISCEIQGKDLVLKDRISYLYPSVSLCENNCTYNRTDFEKERVYCDCAIKKEFDFYRDYKISNYNFSISEIDSLQKGPSSAAAMKCLSDLEGSQAVTKNGAFYYSLSIFGAQIALCAVAASVGLATVNTFLNSAFGIKGSSGANAAETNGNNPSNANNNNNDAFNEVRLQDPSNIPPPAPPKKVTITEGEGTAKSDQNRLNSENLSLKQGGGGIEFIPQEYTFLFFSNQDKGVVKQYVKSRIPFKINPNTTLLLQQIPNVTYNRNLKGPYREDQNIIEIIDDKKQQDFDRAYVYTRDNNNQENEILNIKNKNKNQKYQINNQEDDPRNQELIKIKKIGNNQYGQNRRRSANNNNNNDEKNSNYTNSEDQYTEEGVDNNLRRESDVENADESLFKEIQREARILRSPYPVAFRYETSNVIVLILTEICDKIYFFRTFILTKKYEIFCAKLSLYLIYHILLLTIISLFFDIEHIRKIFNEDNFPDVDFYLLYGFISNLIVWFVYKMLKCLLSNYKRITRLVRLENEYLKTNNEEILELIEKKKKSFMKATKIKVIVFFIIAFVLVIVCGLYLIAWCAVYTGTKRILFKAYGIAIVEIVLIKIIFALILVILRSAAIGGKIKGLYSLIRCIETYFN